MGRSGALQFYGHQHLDEPAYLLAASEPVPDPVEAHVVEAPPHYLYRGTSS